MRGKVVRFYSQALEGLFQAEEGYEQKPKGLSDGSGIGSHRTEAGVGGHGPLDTE